MTKLWAAFAGLVFGGLVMWASGDWRLGVFMAAAVLAVNYWAEEMGEAPE